MPSSTNNGHSVISPGERVRLIHQCRDEVIERTRHLVDTSRQDTVTPNDWLAVVKAVQALDEAEARFSFDQERAVALLKAGHHRAAVAREVGTSHAKITALAQAEGIAVQPYTTPLQLDPKTLRDLRAYKMPLRVAAERYGVSVSRIQRALAATEKAL